MSANPHLAGSQSPSNDSPPRQPARGEGKTEGKIEGKIEGKVEPKSEARIEWSTQGAERRVTVHLRA
jgi:hypothetical protein